LLRVAGGIARGRILKAPKQERPTLGRAKQSLFDILAGRLEGIRFLDLFAGSGAVGIEALSQGAAWATFVELKPRNASLIRENLAVCRFSERAEVFCGEAARVLSRLSRRGESCDMIFLDPPYQNPADFVRALGIIAEKNSLLAPQGIIILQRNRRAGLREVLSSFEVFDTREIGETAIDFLRRL
jgi:16S rRNA (guanine(966)-N(2))-methyltransferase RsmD